MNFFHNKNNERKIGPKLGDKNENNLKQEFINYSYVKLTPADLIGSEEYNQIFFDKIDEIENKILTGNSLNQIVLEYKLEKKSKENVNVSSELTNIILKVGPLQVIINKFKINYLYKISNGNPVWTISGGEIDFTNLFMMLSISLVDVLNQIFKSVIT